jgi:hypothetical protein
MPPQRRTRTRRPSGAGRKAKSEGEFQYSDEIGTTFIDGVTFSAKPVQYLVIDGMAMVEGDITLGTAEQVAQRTEMRRAELSGAPVARGVVISGSQFRWPNCTVPYQIDSSLPNQARVTDAIAHWEANTSFNFVLRTSSNQAQHPNYVEFVPGSGCSSFVGMQGGRQTVTLSSGCSTGNCIHEIGHVVGMWHEQSREDRDAFVTIQWANIIPSAVNNFAQHITDGDDVGAYDYGSIMHYPRNAFSANGQDTIVPTDPSAVIGQRDGLSPGDIAAANSVCIKAIPKELPKDIIKEFPKEGPKEIVKELHKDFPKDPPKDLPKDHPKDLIKEIVKEPPKDPPKGLVEPPKGFLEPPKGVLEPPKGVLEPPKGVLEPPKGVLDPPKGVLEPPKGLVEPGPFPGPTPFVLATGAGAAAMGYGGADASQLLAAYRQVLDQYARLNAAGLLGPADLAMWQQCATAAQQLAAGTGGV